MMDLLRKVELEVRARMAPHAARVVTEELRRRLPSMTLGELHAFLSTELGRSASHVPIADLLATPPGASEETGAAPTQGTEGASAEGLTWKEATLRFQEGLLRKTLVECEWRPSRVARRLDLSRSNIYAMIDRFGVELPRGRPRDLDEPEPEQ